MTSSLRYPAIALSILLCSSVVACSPQPQTEPVTPPAAEQPGEGDDGGGLDGEALVSDKCTGCHEIGRVESAVKDRAGWDSTVRRMERNGLQLTDTERDAIVDHLAERDASR